MSPEGVIATRWWTLEDVEKTAEVVFPEDLRERRRTPGFQTIPTLQPFRTQ